MTMQGDAVAYLWHGINNSGDKVSGEMRARSSEMCKQKLLQQQIVPIKICKAKGGRLVFQKNKIKKVNIIDFSKQLAVLINAGIPLVTSLDVISADGSNPALNNLVREIKTDVENGIAFSSALRRYPKCFSTLFCDLLRVGEAVGTLDIILKQLVTYDEKNLVQKRKIFKALFYPAMVLCVALIVTTILLLFVIPQFKTMFANFNAALPAYTRFVINLAEFVKSNGIFIILCVIAAIICLIKYKKHSENFAHKLDHFVLRLPLFGTLLKKNLTLRFAQTLAITFKAGIPLLESLQIVSEVMNNWTYKQAILRAKGLLASGQLLSVSLERQQLFAPRVMQLIALGEESGTLENMLEEVAKYYDSEVNHIIDTLNDLLEPVIMIVLGVLIGGLVIGMYLPIFRMGNVF